MAARIQPPATFANKDEPPIPVLTVGNLAYTYRLEQTKVKNKSRSAC